MDPNLLDFPLLFALDSAIEHNAQTMASWCEAQGVALAPHAKTHMSKDLVELQLRHGAWGMTAATPAQVRQLAAWGIERIVHANLAVDPGYIGWLAETPAEVFCYVDSVESVQFLAAHLGSHERPLQVLLERGAGRTGARTFDQALCTAEAVAAEPRLTLAGVAGFEGLAPRASDEPVGAVPASVDLLLHAIRETVTTLRTGGLLGERPIVTAGGSSYFDRVVAILGPRTWDEDVHVVLRSGCTLTHDHGLYADTAPSARGGMPRFTPALELRARVLSCPEPGLVIVGFGRRDVPTDERMPLPLDAPHWAVRAVNDHHAYLSVPAGEEPAIGTVLRFGISHPCGAFDRHRRIVRIGDDGAITGELRPAL